MVAASISAGIGVGAGANGLWATTAAPSVIVPDTTASNPTGTSGSTVSPGVGGYGSVGGGTGNGVTGSGSGTGAGGYGFGGSDTTTTVLPRAATSEEVGVVDIDTLLGYQGAQAAGTGMVLTSRGEVLTNNHVVDGATSIKVTVVSTGTTYVAKVVGTDPTQDVAVLQLQNASGLTTVRTDTSVPVVSEPITGVGNAGGVGGAASAAHGQITATGATITATDEDGSNPETLNTLIQDNAAIQAGDSGGPLYNASGQVVGMDTAAGSSRTGSTSGYAITIGRALGVAAQIESGSASSTVHLGYPAFLGVSLSGDQASQATGAVIEQIAADGPAAAAGLAAGDTITAVGSHRITTSTDVQSALTTLQPGHVVNVTWTDQQGKSHTSSITLGTGPAN